MPLPHREIDALERLLARIGPGRTLVFVGDLVDRGPDSVAVVRRVGELIASGRAVATLGNHELNILQGAEKEGNGWFLGHEDHAQHDGKKVVFESRSATAAERAEVKDVLGRMPLVLERADVRVVHAGWDPEAVRKLPVEGDAAALATQAEAALKADLGARGVTDTAKAERAEFARLRDQAVKPTRHLKSVAEEDSALQRGNPVKLLTSGAEVPVTEGNHFFDGGKWRFVDRDRWWKNPVDRPTVIGHYWRRRGEAISGKVDVWGDVPAFAWSGNVFCIDYSVGRRFAERADGTRESFNGGLGALLWPERTVVFDDRPDAVPTTGWLPG